jgi:predicted ribosomally synthesized peptide with nif11-like leader
MSEVRMTKEEFAGALECKTADELVAYSKEHGYDLSQDDAEKFLSQTKEQELSVDNIEDVAGGLCAGAVSIACLGIGLA